jgi:flagellar biosynthetic protein FliQ
MTEQFVVEVGRNAFTTGLLLAMPPLLVALAVGLVISVLQSVTQLNEVTLTFVPKMLAVFVTLLIAGPWMIRTMVEYTANLLALMPHLAR